MTMVEETAEKVFTSNTFRKNLLNSEKLSQLTTPFFRGDAARTAATGAGLGLAIVEKSLQRMGGSLELANAPEGGLMAHIRLKLAP